MHETDICIQTIFIHNLLRDKHEMADSTALPRVRWSHALARYAEEKAKRTAFDLSKFLAVTNGECWNKDHAPDRIHFILAPN